MLALASLYACTGNQEQKKAEGTDTTALTDTSSTAPANLSMNGIPESEAIQMIKDFRTDSTINQPQASIWFSEEFIDALLQTANSSPVKIDGVRIHMAKRDNKNTVVVLLTTKIGPSTIHIGHDIHKDIFMPHSSILSSTGVKNEDSYDRPNGADLYTKTECISNCTGVGSENYVECNTAKTWVENFTTHYQRSKLVNLRSSWYNIKLFQKLQDELRAGSIDKSDGVRLYFARSTKDKHVFILVPTTKMTSGGHQDNYKCYLNFINKDTYDRGEECTPFCDGVVVP